jgi:hypothetical protein
MEMKCSCVIHWPALENTGLGWDTKMNQAQLCLKELTLKWDGRHVNDTQNTVYSRVKSKSALGRKQGSWVYMGGFK